MQTARWFTVPIDIISMAYPCNLNLSINSEVMQSVFTVDGMDYIHIVEIYYIDNKNKIIIRACARN